MSRRVIKKHTDIWGREVITNEPDYVHEIGMEILVRVLYYGWVAIKGLVMFIIAFGPEIIAALDAVLAWGFRVVYRTLISLVSLPLLILKAVGLPISRSVQSHASLSLLAGFLPIAGPLLALGVARLDRRVRITALMFLFVQTATLWYMYIAFDVYSYHTWQGPIWTIPVIIVTIIVWSVYIRSSLRKTQRALRQEYSVNADSVLPRV